MRSTAHVTTRPRYGVLDVIGLLFRELLLMIVVFVVILGLGFAAAMTLKASTRRICRRDPATPRFFSLQILTSWREITVPSNKRSTRSRFNSQ